MNEEIRTVVYDHTLHLEAYRFAGIVQPFPNHFHAYYVIGFVENGQRILSCKNQTHQIQPGSVLLFNPGDNHGCVQISGKPFDYRGFHIPKDTMLELAEEITGKQELPGFSENVIFDPEIACYLRSLHEMVVKGASDFEKEETLLFLMSALIQRYGQPFENCVPECPQEIEKACAYMQQHFRERMHLEQICHHAGVSKSTLLRAFTKSKGITPYRYLEAVRIHHAKALLAQGVLPIDAAIQTGFADQSHFTNYFSRFIRLAPGVYRHIFLEKNKDGISYEK